jgi:hypothetical protein
MEVDTPVIRASVVLESVDCDVLIQTADVLIQTGDRVQGTSRRNSGLVGTALKLVQGLTPRVKVRWDNGKTSLVHNKRSCLVLISADSTGAGAEKVPKPPDTESCMKCKSLKYTPVDPIFFCATCKKGEPGLHLSCARNTGLQVLLNGDVKQDEFEYQCSARQQRPISGEKPFIMNADSRAETITPGPKDSTCSVADVLSKVQRAIQVLGLLPDVSQTNCRILLLVCEGKLQHLVHTNANEETAEQTVIDALFLLTFAAAPENPVSELQVLTTMAHVSPGVSRDMQFLHSQYASIANVQKNESHHERKCECGQALHYHVWRPEYISDIPSIARNLKIHSILSSRVPGGGLDEDKWNRLPLQDDGVLPLPETAEYDCLWHHVPRVPTLIGNATGLPNDNQDPHCDCKWTAEGVWHTGGLHLHHLLSSRTRRRRRLPRLLQRLQP